MASPPWMNLPLCTRVYIRGVHWDKIQPYPRLVGSHTYVQIPLEVSFRSKRSSACWCIGFSTWECQYWHKVCLSFAWIWICSCGSRFKISCSACLSPSYTSNWLSSKLHHLEILSDNTQPWPMTMTLAPMNEAIRGEITRKKLEGKHYHMIWEGCTGECLATQ